jgi:hypothetical protein
MEEQRLRLLNNSSCGNTFAPSLDHNFALFRLERFRIFLKGFWGPAMDDFGTFLCHTLVPSTHHAAFNPISIAAGGKQVGTYVFRGALSRAVFKK